MTDFSSIREANALRATQAQEQSVHKEQLDSSAAMRSMLFQSFNGLIDAIKDNGNKGEAIAMIVKALDELQKGHNGHDTQLSMVESGLKTLEKQLADIPTGDLKQIPKFLEQRDTVKVSNLTGLESAISSLEKAVKAQKLEVKAPDVNVDAPKVTVPAPVVNVDAPNLSPITDAVKEVKTALNKLKAPDVQRTEQQNTLIHEKFDEYKIKYSHSLDEDDDVNPPIAGIVYLFEGKKVAELKYSYDKEGNLLGGKRV
jgi:hypothetical protein